MRITKVKIAGFKSFVDPTTLEFQRNLSGIVGPNGCGKSNIIDAIQWVMGESSAKHLRGDSMADVIFNGSGTRQPVGQASVELIFDNSDGKISGQYASYNEISVKRQVGRDGQSSYFLNGARCRRRDITGIFLGTGIGARSYSIIEQGMISRVIEAKPEELRAFLEEAAGISKYKERRRETENRIHNTRENLARVTDIVVELDKQLQHLQRQAKSAERYQELKRDERATQVELHALRWRTLNSHLETHQKEIGQRSNAMEATLSALRGAERDIVQQREAQAAASNQHNTAQSSFYSVGAEVARIEQQIRYREERRQAMQEELAAAERNLVEVREHIAADEHRLGSLQAQLAELQPRQQVHQDSESQASARVASAEEHLNDWQSRWDRSVQSLADAQRQEHVAQTRHEHLEDAIETGRQRKENLQREQAGLLPDTLRGGLRELEQQVSGSQGSYDRLLIEHARVRDATHKLRDDMHRVSAQLDQLRQQLQVQLGRRASLEALQQSSAGTDREGLAQWLQECGLEREPRLSDLIEVEAGWERAVEVASRLPMHALCISDLDNALRHLSTLREGETAALQTTRKRIGLAATTAVNLPPLASKVRAPWPLDDLFAGAFAAGSAEIARAAMDSLQAGESLVTPDGTVFGPGWVRIDRDTSSHGGSLQRAQELKALSIRIGELEREIEATVTTLDGARTRQLELDQRDQAMRAQIATAQGTVANLRSQMAADQSRLDQVSHRLAQVCEEIRDIEEQLQDDGAELQANTQRLQQAQAQRTALEQQRDQLNGERDQRRGELEEARRIWQERRDQGHLLTAQIGAIQSERTALEQSIARNRGQVDRVASRSLELTSQIEGFEEPYAKQQAERETFLTERVKMEAELAKAREAVQRCDTRLRELEQRRTAVEDEVGQRREELEKARLDARGVETRIEGIRELLSAAEARAEEIISQLPADAIESQWEERLAEISRKIQRLGAINLAAIEEFTTLSERKTYLDRQHADLSEALSTLEEAMRKIDRETRTRFKETFDKVNTGFQLLFPTLFGGGHAVLELAGDDLLETGVTVIARPPGKRNSTIHLLSGGEKALTAVALVFAIFELNPAPFCLLDEVDAPLDDANVARFCDMLRQRARDIQFVFITHNKITMEIADQLVGVTMQEAGVSRLVAVNMDEAIRLAATA